MLKPGQDAKAGVATNVEGQRVASGGQSMPSAPTTRDDTMLHNIYPVLFPDRNLQA